MAAHRKLTGNARRHAAKLVKDYGAAGAARILAAPADTDLAKLRSGNVVPEPVSLSSVALGNIASEFGYALKRGRRANAARPEAVLAA